MFAFRRHPLLLGVIALCVALLGVAVFLVVQRDDRRGPVIATVSNPHPEMISGDAVLVKVTGAEPVRLSVDGRDVSAVTRRPDGSTLALVTGLRPGDNRITATGHGRSTTLTVVDHARRGPVFSGPRQLPFYCETTSFGLAPAIQPLCDAPPVVTYRYRTTAGVFASLTDPAARPGDLATATIGGRSVPYVVRVETGTIDRAVYQIAVLYDGTDPTPLQQDSSWNDRLVYTFGGGCNGGHHQGDSTGGVLNDLFLSQGYAVASSTLNVLDTNCSTIVSAEAAMMVKEHFIDTYGPVAHTIGWGGSGGGIQQYDIADAYPGILDGIIPAYGFPDVPTNMKVAGDCRLLDRFFAGPGVTFTNRQRQAVAGFRDYDSCVSWDNHFADRLTAADSCDKPLLSRDAVIPAADIWNPVSNPGGVRCAGMESYANQFGRDPATGLVRGTLDNVGVQYGLAALRDGTITSAQFVALNTAIGGYDSAGTPVSQRTEADRTALRAAYHDDVLNSAAQGLATTPIIDQRIDMNTSGPLWDVHTTEWGLVMRDRLLRANNSAANQVIIENSTAPADTAAASAYELAAMDRWLTAIAADDSGKGLRDKVIANKPDGLTDGCFLSPNTRVQQSITAPGACATAYPIGADPRLQAGEPSYQDILKCTLRPLEFTAYPVVFSSTEQDQLNRAFPGGVCDYTRPGIGQDQAPRTWIDYGHQ
ncbi:DUF6351 family protein [Nocardia sp. NPDC101769]|uniref:DUF6351 family protein n=1 Tax=Nocardia sp. NPDC101769 TaxID=3364333 RepID=UPI00381D53EF